MNKALVSMAAATCLATAVLYAPTSWGSEGHGIPGFVNHMSRLQYFAHKLGLAIAERNRPLQAYYVHEVEEIIEKLANIENHKGIEVGKLVETVLEPAFEKLEESVEDGSPKQLDGSYEQLLKACNSCHQAAQHGFIRVERSKENPYLQSFAPKE